MCGYAELGRNEYQAAARCRQGNLLEDSRVAIPRIPSITSTIEPGLTNAMRLQFDVFSQWWLSKLRLKRQTSMTWHRDRIKEELAERRQARRAILKLSETCDVLFSFARARHDGNGFRHWPRTNEFRYFLPYTYMIFKYTSRYGLYRAAGVLSGSSCAVREVVNPARMRNIDEVADRHGIDRSRFQSVCRGLHRIWPLLP